MCFLLFVVCLYFLFWIETQTSFQGHFSTLWSKHWASMSFILERLQVSNVLCVRSLEVLQVEELRFSRKWSFDTLKDFEGQETLSSFSLNHFLLGCFSPWTHSLIWQSEPHCWFYRVYMFDFSETVCVDWTDDEIWSNLNSFQRKTLISL